MNFDNNYMSAAMLETLRTSIPEKQRSAIVDSMFKKARDALITVDALQKEVVRLLAENERLSARNAELEAREK